MGLWESGSIDGLTVAMLQRIATRAHTDHNFLPEECDYQDCDHSDEMCPRNRKPIAPMLAPHAMQVNEVTMPKGDMAFDRVSHARWQNERFSISGNTGTWQVTDYGATWRIREVETGETITADSESHLAGWVTASCGAHPDPYIAMVEVTYDVAGHRAGYGVRKSGACSCFYD